MWVTYVVKVCDTLQPSKEAVTNLSGRYSFTESVTMFYALKEQNVGENIQSELKSTLMTRWIWRKETYNEVFKLLKLDKTPQSIKLHKDARNELLSQYEEELMKTQS